MHFYTYIIHV